MLGSNISCILLFLLSAFVCGTHNLDYSDLETMGAACMDLRTTATPPDSCVGYMDDKYYLDRNCECDFACNSFKDCCIDAYHRRRPASRARRMDHVTCLHYGVHKYGGVYMIASCSNSWRGSSEIRRGCEGPQNVRDPLNAAPVTNAAQRVTYKNRFCAECNNAALETLKTFELKLNCEGLTLTEQQIMADLEYNERLGSWGIPRFNSLSNANDFFTCEIIFDVPDYLNNSVRFCRSNVTSSCPPDWNRQQIRERCDEYMAVVYDNLVAYRNPHCAICNNRTVDEISCHHELIGRKRPMSFALLLDVNQSDGDQVGMRQITTPQCPANHKYDPFFKKCRRLVCALPGHVVVDGRCVRE